MFFDNDLIVMARCLGQNSTTMAGCNDLANVLHGNPFHGEPGNFTLTCTTYLHVFAQVYLLNAMHKAPCQTVKMVQECLEKHNGVI